jgi:transposase
MKTPVKFVSALDEAQIKNLKALMKNSPLPSVRMRAHFILLSSQEYSIDQISKIYNAYRGSVSSWIDAWEKSGIDGLYDKPRSGSPSKLSESDLIVFKELMEDYSNAPKTFLAKLVEKTGKIISRSTFKRIAKSLKLRWKRTRKSIKNKRDEKEFNKVKEEIQELKEQQVSGNIDLFFFDESGFSLNSSVPYAYQPIGKTVEIPALKSSRLNVLGFYALDNRFESFCFECSIDSRVVAKCFDEFSKIITKKTFVVIDNSPMHHSEEFESNIKKWKRKGLFLKYLSTYSPELNPIEILWRFIKYHWLPLSAYLSFKNLVNSVEDILKNIGTEYKISFASKC